ncbi:cysteine and tyrosine-rich protein 1-like [Ruditapes philippinarum]|uniref:cysteine and tyrosine-rich protein 1-like n=1 Tax=Ruditapes philippinarum TaxID=129788 RepID=UPI00295B3909|nr:cysteine and tyrosine-rich protein 1-like [Ruditapes philippinarum]
MYVDITQFATTIVFLVAALFTDVCNGGSYCMYLHEDYYTFNQKYCEAGCCNDYGDEDEICCFSWTVGIILGVCFACIGFIAIVVFVIICCYTMKKRSRAGQIINPAPQTTQNNMVVYTASAGYSYPHPPSAFYPGSRFPGQPMAPPPYTAGTQPAYPPTYSDQSQVPPPSFAGLYGQQHTGQAPTMNGQSGQSQNNDQQYGGYGTGQS